jgi:hypothetical protein
MRAPEGEYSGDVSLEREPGETNFAATTLVRRFLSAAAWKWRVPIREIAQGGGTHRFRVGGRQESHLKLYPGLNFSSLDVGTNQEQDRALALYREALGLEPNQTYKFLGLLKILNITLTNGPEQIRWIDQHLQQIPFPAAARVAVVGSEIATSKRFTSVGDYLFAAGRSAMAHAFQPPFVDPDDAEHTYKINLDLPVVESLANLYMERELGLPTDQ